MAKSRKRKSETRRDAFAIASGRSPLLASFDPLRSGLDLLAVEDRRRFTPGLSKPRTVRQVARVLMALPGKKRRPPKAAFSVPEVHAFALPKTTAICVRRAIRKEVIHAKGRAGNKVRRPKRNQFSRVSCRRK